MNKIINMTKLERRLPGTALKCDGEPSFLDVWGWYQSAKREREGGGGTGLGCAIEKFNRMSVCEYKTWPALQKYWMLNFDCQILNENRECISQWLFVALIIN